MMQREGFVSVIEATVVLDVVPKTVRTWGEAGNITEYRQAWLNLLPSHLAVAGNGMFDKAIKEPNPMPGFLGIQCPLVPSKFNPRIRFEDLCEVQSVMPV